MGLAAALVLLSGASVVATDDPSELTEPAVVIAVSWEHPDDLLMNYSAAHESNGDPTLNPSGGISASHAAGCGADAMVHDPPEPLVITSDPSFDPGHAAWSSYEPGRFDIVVFSNGWCVYPLPGTGVDGPALADQDRADALVALLPEGTEVDVAATVTFHNLPGATDQTFTGTVPVSSDGLDPGQRRVLGSIVLPDLAAVGDVAADGGEQAAGDDEDIDAVPPLDDGDRSGADDRDGGAPATATDDGEQGSGDVEDTADAPAAATGESDAGGGSNLAPVLIVLAVALLAFILVLAKQLGGRSRHGAERIVDAATSMLVLEPKTIVERAEELEALAPAADTATTKTVRVPPFVANEEPSGRLTVKRSVTAVSPDGESLTLPPGTSYPAGATVTIDDKPWLPVKHGDDWWWVDADESGFHVTREGVGFGEGPPKKLTPLPYSYFELAEQHVWTEPSGPDTVARHVLEPGRYSLGEVHSTPDGNVYELWRYVDDKWQRHGRIRESALPPR